MSPLTSDDKAVHVSPSIILIILDNIAGVSIKNNLVYIGENQTLATIPTKLEIIIDGRDLNTDAYDNDLSINWGLGEEKVAPDDKHPPQMLSGSAPVAFPDHPPDTSGRELHYCKDEAKELDIRLLAAA